MTTTPTPAARPRGRIGPFGIAQILGVEVALAALLFVPGVPLTWLGAVAAAVLLFGLGFSRGRSWIGWAGQWWRWRRRVRIDRRDDREPGPRWQVDGIGERGIDVGVAFDGTGWFSAVRLENEAAPAQLLHSLTQILQGSEVPVSAVQLVTRTVPGMGSDSWFTVRLDVRGSHSVATDRGGGAVGVHRALSTVVRRLLKGRDGDSGIVMRALDARELTKALTYSLDGGADSADRPSENWTNWRTGEAAHATYWLRGALQPGTGGEKLWTKLAELDASSHTVSLALRKASPRPSEKRLVLRCLVRLTSEQDDVRRLGRQLGGLAREHHLKLVRCNGIQGPAGYASAMTGGAW